MKMIVTTVLTAMALVSVAAPAWADVPVGPPNPGGLGCIVPFVIVAVLVGVILIVRHNKKKQPGE